MSSFSGSVAPSLPKVKTHGDLHGDDIAEGARSAKSIVAEIARNPKSKSAQSLAAEEVLRAQARVLKGKGISKFERVADGLKREGIDIFTLAGV